MGSIKFIVLVLETALWIPASALNVKKNTIAQLKNVVAYKVIVKSEPWRISFIAFLGSISDFCRRWWTPFLEVTGLFSFARLQNQLSGESEPRVALTAITAITTDIYFPFDGRRALVERA